MASIKGTALNYLDLAAKIKDFLSTGLGASNWRILRENNGAVEYDAPGLSGKEHIYLSIEPGADAAKDHYYFTLRGSIAFIEGNPIYGQPSGVTTYTPLINAQMNYWITANGQRAIIVVRVASVYMLMYLGKFLPYATPSQYPYPVLVSGMVNDKKVRFSSSNLSGFQNPEGAMFLFGFDNSVNQVSNKSHRSCRLFPTKQLPDLPVNNDNIVLIPFILNTSFPIKNIFGELDGVFWVSGFGLKSEDTLKHKEKNLIIFQNGNKTAWGDYMAMEIDNV